MKKLLMIVSTILLTANIANAKTTETKSNLSWNWDKDGKIRIMSQYSDNWGNSNTGWKTYIPLPKDAFAKAGNFKNLSPYHNYLSNDIRIIRYYGTNPDNLKLEDRNYKECKLATAYVGYTVYSSWDVWEWFPKKDLRKTKVKVECDFVKSEFNKEKDKIKWNLNIGYSKSDPISDLEKKVKKLEKRVSELEN